MNQKGNTIGLVAFIFFGIAVLLLGFTIALTFIPRDNEYRSNLTWAGLLIGFNFVFFGIPMLIASLVTSIISIIKIHRQRIGYVVLAGNIVIGLGVLGWLFR